MRRRVFLTAAVAVMTAAPVFACIAKTEPPPGPTASQPDADVDDVGDSRGATCALTDGQCAGDQRCCPPLGGFRVDLVGNCKSPTFTALYCSPPTGRPVTDPSVKRCPLLPKSTCFWRVLEGGSGTVESEAGGEAGANTSIEVYLSSHYVAGIPGYEGCGGDLSNRVAAAAARDCGR